MQLRFHGSRWDGVRAVESAASQVGLLHVFADDRAQRHKLHAVGEGNRRHTENRVVYASAIALPSFSRQEVIA